MCATTTSALLTRHAGACKRQPACAGATPYSASPRRCFTRTTTLTWLRAVATVVAIAPAHTSEWPLWLPHGTTRQTTRGAEKSE